MKTTLPADNIIYTLLCDSGIYARFTGSLKLGNTLKPETKVDHT